MCANAQAMPSDGAIVKAANTKGRRPEPEPNTSRRITSAAGTAR
jgi:hypothetical protein